MTIGKATIDISINWQTLVKELRDMADAIEAQAHTHEWETIRTLETAVIDVCTTCDLRQAVRKEQQ